MPVALKNLTIHESSEYVTDYSEEIRLLKPAPIEHCVLDEQVEYLDQIAKYMKGLKENNKLIEKYKSKIQEAQENDLKAKEKYDISFQRIQLIKETHNRRLQKSKEAAEYWTKDQGIDVVDLSNETNDFTLYKFIYSKLPKDLKRLTKELRTLAACNDYFVYSIVLKHHNSNLFIDFQEPVLLTNAEVGELNDDLTKTCVSMNESNNITVDYKLAYVKIKKAILRTPPTIPNNTDTIRD